MTTITLDRGTRATLKRALAHKKGGIAVNTNGDLYDFDTLATFNPDTPRGLWHMLTPNGDATELVTADSYTVTDTEVTLRHGARTTRLETETSDARSWSLTPASIGNAHSVTITSVDGVNHQAAKLLRTSASNDTTLPLLCGLKLYLEAGTVAAVTTDRYTLAMAALDGETTGDFQALLNGTILREMAARSKWTLTATTNAASLTHTDLGLTLISENLRDEFPPVRRLIPNPLGNNTITTTPKALRESTSLLHTGRGEPVVVTTDGTTYAEDTDTVTIPAAETTTDTPNNWSAVGLNPTYLANQAKAVGAKWPTVTLRWTHAHKPVYLDYGHGLTTLIMPLRTPLTRQDPSTAAA